MRNDFFRCKKCLNMSTRPRIEFNEDGVCNACLWAEEKRTSVNWPARWQQLENIADQVRRKNGDFDCIIPVSGGKDSSYVSYMVKHKLGLQPLCVTIPPPLALPVGQENLSNFSRCGFNILSAMPDFNVMRHINKIGFKEFGIPMLGWQIAIQCYIPKLAAQMGIPLIIYGEDGEVEYGGSTETKNSFSYSVEYSKKIYLAGTYHKILQNNFSKKELSFFTYPTDAQLAATNVIMTHWSYFEPWDSNKNYEVAKKYCGLKERPSDQAAGTFIKIGQNDTCLYDLHTYLMFLKFGFGRATQDANIEIRAGKITREEGIELVQKYDHWQPNCYLDRYAEYYEISQDDIISYFEKFANQQLLQKVNGAWELKNKIL